MGVKEIILVVRLFFSTTKDISCKINQRAVCIQKEEDGLRDKNSNHLNLSFLAKWVWRLLSNEDGAWKKINFLCLS